MWVTLGFTGVRPCRGLRVGIGGPSLLSKHWSHVLCLGSISACELPLAVANKAVGRDDPGEMWLFLAFEGADQLLWK